MERVRAGYEAFNRGDLDAATAGFHPEVEWHVLGVLPETEVYRGPQGVRQFWKPWTESFEDLPTEVQEIIEAGDAVLVVFTVSGSGRGSGAEVRTPPFAQLWRFDGGKVVRVEMFPDKQQALAALRLPG